MRFRAIAVASERSNAVGTVELECTPNALVLLYLGVGAFSEGYAPGPLADNQRLEVPWPSIAEAAIDGEQLFLALDSKFTPLNRIVLANFSSGNLVHHHELYQRRFLTRIGTAGAAVVGALIAGGAAPHLAPGTTFQAALAIAVATALVVLGLGFFADRLIASGGLEGPEAREACFAELSAYLPQMIRRLAPLPERPKLEPSLFVRLQGLLPRATAGVVLSLSAAALAAVLTAHALMTRDPERELALRAQRGPDPSEAQSSEFAARTMPSAPAFAPVREPEPVAAASAARQVEKAAHAEGGCRCRRSDSLLWAAPFPRLSVLTLSHRVRRGRKQDERGDKRYSELEVAVINNSNEPLKEVALMVQFSESDPPPSSKRYLVSNRPLYFEGPLTPGQAIKWSVEAQGSEYEIENPFKGNVGSEGELAAPTNLLADLLRAHNRPVRLHGAMLLTFFGDARAKDAILELREALREDEAPYLDRLLFALSPERVCALSVSDAGPVREVHACVFNAKKESAKDLGLRVRALDRGDLTERPAGLPPNVLAEATIPVPGELAPDTGTRVSASFDLGGTNPVAFEAFADRIDLLPR